MDDTTRLMKKAMRETDPAKKRELLSRVLAQEPDHPDALRELLYLGRLGLKRSVDFHAFRSYLLNVFDQPQQYNETKRGEMIAELTGSPELEACLRVFPDREAFMKEYLRHISDEYVRVFMESDNHRNGTLMGIKLGNHGNRMASYAADMLKNAKSAELPVPWDQLVPEALLQAFDRCWGNADRIESLMEEDD